MTLLFEVERQSFGEFLVFLQVKIYALGFKVWSLGFRDWGQGSGFGGWGLGVGIPLLPPEFPSDPNDSGFWIQCSGCRARDAAVRSGASNVDLSTVL